MFRYLYENFIQRALRRAARSRFVPALTGLLALVQTATLSLPVTAVVVPAVLIARPQWKSIVLQAAFGSALGATLLVMVFHDWGWQAINAAFPTLLGSPAGQHVVAWVGKWGLLGLFAIAALPVPQAPALVFFALGQPVALQILVALLAGKLIKYGVVAGATVLFPEKFGALIMRRVSRRR